MSNDEREKRRISALNKNKNNLNNKGQLKFYWKITSPNNDTRIVHGLREYCEANKICRKAMERLASGKRKFYKGYHCIRLVTSIGVDLPQQTP